MDRHTSWTSWHLLEKVTIPPQPHKELSVTVSICLDVFCSSCSFLVCHLPSARSVVFNLLSHRPCDLVYTFPVLFPRRPSPFFLSHLSNHLETNRFLKNLLTLIILPVHLIILHSFLQPVIFWRNKLLTILELGILCWVKYSRLLKIFMAVWKTDSIPSGSIASGWQMSCKENIFKEQQMRQLIVFFFKGRVRARARPWEQICFPCGGRESFFG